VRARDAARKAAPGTAQRKLRDNLSAYGNELLDQVLNEHAHELAEKIRNHDWDEGCAGVGCCADTPDMAADLIDPEKS
jgi:hypothetical protein